jgi:hypothetical protein
LFVVDGGFAQNDDSKLLEPHSAKKMSVDFPSAIFSELGPMWSKYRRFFHKHLITYEQIC